MVDAFDDFVFRRVCNRPVRFDVDDHTGFDFRRVVNLEFCKIFVARICDRSCEFSAAVAEKHTCEVSLTCRQKSFHFGVQKVYERARVVHTGSQCFVGNFDFAKEVFKVGGKRNVGVALRLGKRARFGARRDAAVYAVGYEFFDFLTENIVACSFDRRKEGVDFRVELLGNHAKVNGF